VTAIGDSIVMTILLSPKTANYISLIGDIHYGSPNSHIYFTYIQPLFHYGKRLVSHRETKVSAARNNSFKALETTLVQRETKHFLVARLLTSSVPLQS